MDLSYFFYSFLLAIAAYIGAAILGALILPLFLAPEGLLRFISGITDREINTRDKILFPFTKIFIRFGVHPNVITIVGVVLVAWLLAAFLRGADPSAIFILIFLAGFTDMIDGPVARASGKVTVPGGILDKIRDALLILVVTAGVIFNGLIDPTLLIWFFCGEAIIFLFKFWESALRGKEAGVFHLFVWRAAGEGALSIDRIKFFFFIAAMIMSIGDAFFSANLSPLVFALFLCSFFFILSSILTHAFLIQAASGVNKAGL